jgi:tetratricopeptide (TPR) repeat protein
MRYLSLLLLSAGLAACHQTDTHTAVKNSDIHLQLSSLYNRDTIKLVLEESAVKHKEADKIFLQAIDAYRNKKNPAASITLFKNSILLQPQAKAYYELGNALLDIKEPLEATNAYTIAEQLDYTPLHKVLYNQACAYSLLGYREKARYYLVSAIEFGYSNLKNILNDPDLKNIRENNEPDFRQMVISAFGGATDPEKLQWNLFCREFEVLDLPVVLDRKYADKLGNQYIAYDFERYIPEMRDNEFSRDVGSVFYAIGQVKNTDSVRTLIYASREELGDSEADPLYYLCSYTNHGKLIQKMLIGGRETLDEPYRIPTIQPNGDVQVALFKIVYEKDPHEAGSEDNKIIEMKELDKEYYTWSADGHFTKQPALLGMR